MKKLLFVTCLCLFTNFYLIGQTNTFPTSGNVGVGTTSPIGKLDIKVGGWGNIPSIIFNQTNDHPSIRLYRPTGATNPYTVYPWWIENNKNLAFKTGSTNEIGSETVVEVVTFTKEGNVGIGTTTPDAKLAVKGNIHTNEVKVDLLGAVAPDYVFYKDYNLKTLSEVEDYITIKGHLPNMPSAQQMKAEGIKLKEMNLKLLEKIEELTLYAIDQEKETTTLKKELQNQKTINNSLEARLQKIEAFLDSKKQ